ncbi:glycosyltransferase [Flavobacterium magnum]|nr:glycosyltransferase [Flavobacterium magnum]
MHERALHIISMDNPFPPDFGGVIDVFFKIRALHRIGYRIYLHTFAEEIPASCPQLEAITEKVFYYRFSGNPLWLLSTKPFSVMTRNDASLHRNLAGIPAPILFEGLKTTYLVNAGRLDGFTKILRLHNIEQDYFKGISRTETSLLKKFAFWMEAVKFRAYERVIRSFDHTLALSLFEEKYIQRKFGNASYVPVFHGNEAVADLSGTGKFALYHGDLNTADNREAVRFLINAFKEIPDVRLVIASGSGEGFVRRIIRGQSNAAFIALKDFSHLKSLMAEAHINVCWSFQQSGTKLKVINALFNGRFCIINDNITDDPNVSDLCITANDKKQLIDAVNLLKDKTYDDFQRRQAMMKSCLDDGANALLIDKILRNQ